MKKPSILIGIAEDHTILRKGLINLINQFESCRVILEAANGAELQQEIERTIPPPEIILLDINMPVINGYEALSWLQKHHPGIQVIVLTMYDSEFLAARLFREGAKALLNKNISPDELKNAIYAIKETGYYYNNIMGRRLLKIIYLESAEGKEPENYYLTPKELDFLRLAATELTYEKIAAEMHLTIRAVDKLRDHLFLRFDVKNRAALAVKSLMDGVVV